MAARVAAQGVYKRENSVSEKAPAGDMTAESPSGIKICIVETMDSFAKNPAARAIAILPSPKPRNEKRGAIFSPRRARMLISPFAIGVRSGVNKASRSTITQERKTTVAARTKKSFSLFFTSLKRLTGRGKRYLGSSMSMGGTSSFCF